VHRWRPDLPLDLTPEQCARLQDLHPKTDLGAVDCPSEVLGIGSFDAVWRQSVEVVRGSNPLGSTIPNRLDSSWLQHF
jgi:hypothetical protein